MSENTWKTAGTAGDSWKPENKGDSIQGIFKGIKTDVGINKSNVYTIQTEADELISVWGSTVLDTKFEEIEVGDEVKIEFAGLVKGKGPKPYKDFDVQYRQVENAVSDKEIVEEIFKD
jgi:hypothetical protein